MAETQSHCGHPVSEIIGSDEGTHYCAVCEQEARAAQEREARVALKHGARPVEGQTANLLTGCGDHSCVIARPTGMGTNGGCRCPDYKLRHTIRVYRSDLAAARQEAAELQAARVAYASEFQLVRGEPDVGSIHANIREMKTELAAARQELADSQQSNHVDQQVIAELNARLAHTEQENGRLHTLLTDAQSVIHRLCDQQAMPDASLDAVIARIDAVLATPPVPEPEQKMKNTKQSGAELIAQERQRQMEQEGWTERHDDQHDRNELNIAARIYALHAEALAYSESNVTFRDVRRSTPQDWPWHPDWWKPSDNPIRDLTKAGALIAAEIDRLQRAATLEPEE